MTDTRAALAEAERFLSYFSGETDGVFVGPGTPQTCLAQIREALNRHLPGRLDCGVTDEMLNAHLRATHAFVEPFPAEYEEGTQISCAMTQENADEINADLRDDLRKGYEAALYALPPTLNSGAVEQCAKWHENEANLLTNSLHCGDNSQTIGSAHRQSRWHLAAAKALRALPRAVDGGALPQAGPGSGGAGGQSIVGAGVAGIEQPRTYGEYCKNPSDTVAPCSPDLLKAMDYKWQP